ncbi:MAG: GNAT family N-acetyltransferase [Anaerolineae bacterium]
MIVREIDTEDRSDVNRFIDFSFDLYEGCEQWVPPLVSSLRLAMDRRRHPFYHHSDAAFFVAELDGQVAGRIAALDNERYNAYNDAKVAFFYYFDVIHDQQVAQGLLDAAADWARSRGLEKLMGPKGPLRSDPYGILFQGFEYRAAMSMPYNYPYYADLLTAAGFEKEIDYVSGHISGSYELPERLVTLIDRIKTRRGFWVKSFETKRELRKWIPEIQRVNNAAFTDIWGYYPIDDAEVRMIGKQLLTIADPRLIKIVMKDDEIAGFAFLFPDVGETLRSIRGRLWPFGWIKVLIALHRTDRLLANGIGLLPKYQGLGASALLYHAFRETVDEDEANYCEIAQIMETNIKSLGDMNMLGVDWHKVHRVYRRSLL